MNDVFLRFLLSLALDLGRYVLVAGPVFLVFWLWLGDRLQARWLRPTSPDQASMRREILASLRTAVIFATFGAAVFAGTRAGVFRIYEDAHLHGIPYLLVTPLLLIILQDTYFYFTHRAMHHRSLFRVMHFEHHVSRHTSPFTAYAFSPLEACVHALFVPLATLFMPAHELALFAFLGFMIVRNVLGHLAIELYPAGFVTSRFGRTQTTTTHHALHHLRPNTNYGLYFTLWDRVLGTTDATYERRFQAATREKPTLVSPGQRV